MPPYPGPNGFPAKKESGHPVVENKVGFETGDVNASSSSISARVSAQLRAAACARPSAQAAVVSAHALRPSPKSAVGRIETAAPPWSAHRSATSSGNLPVRRTDPLEHRLASSSSDGRARRAHRRRRYECPSTRRTIASPGIGSHANMLLIQFTEGFSGRAQALEAALAEVDHAERARARPPLPARGRPTAPPSRREAIAQHEHVDRVDAEHAEVLVNLAPRRLRRLSGDAPFLANSIFVVKKTEERQAPSLEDGGDAVALNARMEVDG